MKSSELSDRKKRLAKWLQKNNFCSAVFLKEDMEELNGDFIYYGGKLNAEYAAIVVGSDDSVYAIAHEYAFDKVKSTRVYDRVYKIRQSTEQLVFSLGRLFDECFSQHGNIAFDFSCLNLNTYYLLRQKGIKIGRNRLTGFVHSERSLKSPYEVKQMNQAIEIAKRAFEKTIASLKEGQALSEISKSLNQNLLEEGATAPSFETEVQIIKGPSGASALKLRRGDIAFFDFGVRLPSGYCSDVGRTIPYGHLSESSNDFLNDVMSIKKEGLKKIKSGISGNAARSSIDKLIDEYGYVPTHRPGHQIGINVHEPYGPNLALGKENSMKLKDRNVVTWEPGIGVREGDYSKNIYGMAHVEDMVLVGESSKMLGDFDLDYR